jgi:hypothetical protein
MALVADLVLLPVLVLLFLPKHQVRPLTFGSKTQ